MAMKPDNGLKCEPEKGKVDKSSILKEHGRIRFCNWVFLQSR